MSGWVTVSGPPRSNWRWNSGTTEPVLPSTLPKRTVTQRMPRPAARARRCPAPGSTSRPAASSRPSRWSGSPPCRWRSAPSPARRRRAPHRRHGGCRRHWSAPPPAGWPRPSARASARRRGTPAPAATARTRRGSAPRRGCRPAATARGTCGWRSAQLEVDQPERVFAVVEQDQPRRPERRDLARQLAADRAAGAGDDHPPALDQPRHAFAVERHLRRGPAGPRSPSAAVRARARDPALRPGPATSGAARGGCACRSASACSTRPASDWPARSGVATTSVSGSLPSPPAVPARRRHPRSIRGTGSPWMRRPVWRAADRQQALDPQRTAAGPRPAHAGTGRCPRWRRPPAPTECQGRSRAGVCRHADARQAAIDDARRAEQHQQGQRMHDGKAGLPDAAPVTASRRRTGRRRPRWTTPPRAGRRCPAKRQYCHGSLNGNPASSNVAAPAAGSHGGCSQPPDGSATARASGTANAASAPRLRHSERFARVGALSWRFPIAHPAKGPRCRLVVQSRSKGCMEAAERPAIFPFPSSPNRFWSILAGSCRLGGDSCRSSLRASAQGDATAGEDRCRAVHG